MNEREGKRWAQEDFLIFIRKLPSRLPLQFIVFKVGDGRNKEIDNSSWVSDAINKSPQNFIDSISIYGTRSRKSVKFKYLLFCTSDKGLLSNNNKNPLKTQQESSQHNHKWDIDMNRHLIKEDIQRRNKHMKRCSTSCMIR